MTQQENNGKDHAEPIPAPAADAAAPAAQNNSPATQNNASAPQDNAPEGQDNAAGDRSGTGDFRLGQRVWGPILRMTENHAVVSLSEQGLAEGTLDLVHLRDDFGNLSVAEGDEVQAFVVKLEPAIKLAPSLYPPAAEVMRRLREAMDHDAAVRGRVTGVNRGGLDVQIDGRRAFCPYSQIELARCEDPTIYLNHILDFRVLELEEEKRRIVLSRRAILEEERKEKLSELRGQLKAGAEFEGVVRRLQPFGAFVDIGNGVEGLVHVSEISYDRLDHPSEVLREGEKIRVKVLDVSPGKGGRDRIKLSLKATIPDPWTQVTELFHERDIVTGIVVRVIDFGAFVKLHPGIEGLLHVSQYKPRGAGDAPPTPPAAAQQAPVTDTGGATAEPATEAAVTDAGGATAKPATEAPVADAGGTTAEPATEAAVADTGGAAAVSDATPKAGEEITVRITRIDAQRRRISLALRDEDRPDQPRVDHDAIVGETVEGVVRSIKRYGVFLDLPSLGSWVSGLLPSSETPFGRETNIARKFNEGDKIRVVIIEVDERGRIRLSQRRLIEREERGAAGGRAAGGKGVSTAPPGGFNLIAEAFQRAEQRRKSKSGEQEGSEQKTEEG
ncbi:MAG: S1 RNA-binding domain-containing protein [Candidatus Eisenbacteria sp.]|nr:S1 RNA-binding domain-containing protein [Candidatus Eisenbacteria bacterium]